MPPFQFFSRKPLTKPTPIPEPQNKVEIEEKQIHEQEIPTPQQTPKVTPAPIKENPLQLHEKTIPLIEELQKNSDSLQNTLAEIYSQKSIRKVEFLAKKANVRGNISPKHKALAHFGNFYVATQTAVEKLQEGQVEQASTKLQHALDELKELENVETVNRKEYQAQTQTTQQALQQLQAFIGKDK